VSVHEATYMWFFGPTFETPAEVKVARLLGADVIGMSIVPEVILARRLALRVAAIAVVTSLVRVLPAAIRHLVRRASRRFRDCSVCGASFALS
jgi:purine-nucleoside phosphorylase